VESRFVRVGRGLGEDPRRFVEVHRPGQYL
jgi:hypothetical protein